MKAYQFWYKMTAYATTEYLYVIALSPAQACFFWFKYLKEVVGRTYDYAISHSDVIDEKDFATTHKVGNILGEYSII